MRSEAKPQRVVTIPAYLMVGAVLALTLASIFQSYQRTKDEAASRLAVTLAVGENSITRTFDAVLFALGNIAAAFDSSLSAGPGSARLLAGQILRASPYMRQILILDGEQRVLYDSAASGLARLDLAALGLVPAGGEFVDRLAIAPAMPGRYLGTAEAASGQWVIPAMVTAHRQSGDLLRVVVGLNPLFFASVLDGVRTEEPERIAMVRFDGARLAASPSPNGAWPAIAPQILAALPEADHGRLNGFCPFARCPGFVVFKSSPTYPVALVAGMTREQLVEEWLRSDWPLLVPMAGLPLLVAAVMWAQSRLVASRLTLVELRRLAHHDPLTGLPNRLLLDDRLEAAIGRAARNRTLIAVIFIDLNDFKPINDTHGHAVGDKVLVDVAARLRESVRLTDTVARLGGDEFVAILEQISSEREIQRLAAKIVKAVSQPAMVDGVQVTVGASLGIAVYPKDGSEPGALLDKADEAMYCAKPVHGICLYPDHVI